MPTRILVVDDSPTIRTVVSMILERSGYDPKVASDGQDAYDVLASGEVKADLVLVDFVMPRMNGYQFCRALRENAELSNTPVVLMSAKGDRIRDQFVQQTGAIDAITKPFDRQALVAVIENALRKVNSTTANVARASSARLPDYEDDNVTAAGTVDQLDLDLSGLSNTPSTPVGVVRAAQPVAQQPIEFETRRTHIAQIVAQKLAAIVARTIASRPTIASSTNLANAIADRLSNDAIVEMMEAIGALDRRDRGGPLLAGDLGAVPIGAILQLLQAENQTGVLVCTNGGAEVRATFRDGAIDLVQSIGAGDEFRLGRFFVEEGVLTPQEIDDITQRTRAYSDPSPSSSQPPLAPLAPPTPNDTTRGLGDSLGEPLETIETPIPAMPIFMTGSLPTRRDPTAALLANNNNAESPLITTSSTAEIATVANPPGGAAGDTQVFGRVSAIPATVREELQHGALTVPGHAMAEALAAVTSKPRPLGMALLAAGKIVESQLRTALTRQSSELLYEVLRWPKGRFELRREPPSELAENARLGMPVASVVMEGFRRVDEWRALERTLGSFDAVLLRDDSAFGRLDVHSLPAREKAVLDAVDGERTVRAIVLASHLSSFDACRILVQFLEARVLRRRS
jgi:DNA-binding response OmpR family regulator